MLAISRYCQPAMNTAAIRKTSATLPMMAYGTSFDRMAIFTW